MRRHASLRHIRHATEGLGLHALVAASRVLDVDRASALGGGILRTLGPRLPLHRTADRNLRRILPDLDAAGRERVLTGMWDNLGRLGVRVSASPPAGSVWRAGCVTAGRAPENSDRRT